MHPASEPGSFPVKLPTFLSVSNDTCVKGQNRRIRNL